MAHRARAFLHTVRAPLATRGTCRCITAQTESSMCLQRLLMLDYHHQPTCMAHPPTYLNKVLVGFVDGTIHLWNVAAGTRLFIFHGWGNAVRCLAPSPALDVVAVGLADGSVVILNVLMNEVVMRFGNAAAGGTDGAANRRNGGDAAAATAGACNCLAFRTGSGPPLMAVAGAAGAITVWNLKERRLHTIIKGAHAAAVTHLHFFAGEPVLMSSGADNAVTQWIFDNEDGTARRLRGRSGHAAPPRCVRFYGSEGAVLLTAAEDRSVRAFSIIQDQQSRELSQARILRLRALTPHAHSQRQYPHGLAWHVFATALYGDP